MANILIFNNGIFFDLLITCYLQFETHICKRIHKNDSTSLTDYYYHQKEFLN